MYSSNLLFSSHLYFISSFLKIFLAKQLNTSTALPASTPAVSRIRTRVSTSLNMTLNPIEKVKMAALVVKHCLRDLQKVVNKAALLLQFPFHLLCTRRTRTSMGGHELGDARRLNNK